MNITTTINKMEAIDAKYERRMFLLNIEKRAEIKEAKKAAGSTAFDIFLNDALIVLGQKKENKTDAIIAIEAKYEAKMNKIKAEWKAAKDAFYNEMFGEDKPVKKVMTIQEAAARIATKKASGKKLTLKAPKKPILKHKILLDTEEFNRKPILEAGRIQNRLPGEAATVTIEELAKAVTAGRTFKAAYLTGKSSNTFVSSSLMVIDVDNKPAEQKLYGYISLGKFKEIAAKSKYKPALIYTTFSHTEKTHKYRAVFQLGRVITNLNELKAIGEALQHEYPFADAAVTVTHMIYGGKNIIHLDPLAVINPMVEFDAEVKQTASASTHITETNTDKIILTEDILTANLSDIREDFEGLEIDIVNSFEWINRNVPMSAALGFDINTRFRCVFEEHEDKNPSARIAVADGQQYYICSCTNTYLSLIDLIAKALDKDKITVQNIIADALGITIGSKYQQKMRAFIADTIAKTDKLITEDSVLYKAMKQSNLHGIYNLIQQFAAAHITVAPLGEDNKITFFMAQSQIQKKMLQNGLKGAGSVGYKLDRLKELGLIRALSDLEINAEALKKANEIKNNMILKAANASKYINRIEYYELTLLTPAVIAKAEALILKEKELGVKRRIMNSTRRVAAFGEEYAQTINVQINVSAKANKAKNNMDKVLNAAGELIEQQGYFTEAQLLKAFNSNRNMNKEKAIKVMNDAIPIIIRTLDIKKDRVKKATREVFTIPANVATNTTIYCIKDIEKAALTAA